VENAASKYFASMENIEKRFAKVKDSRKVLPTIKQ
jgi:hypothetical protein